MAKSHAHSEAVEVISRECLATRMRRLNRVVSGIYDRAFRPIGATASQMSILVVLAKTDGAKPAEVCLALQMDKSTLCRNVQRMLRLGWVRTTATDDARSHRLEVTGPGRELIERALPLWRAAQSQAREALGSAVADQLFRAVDAPFSRDRLGVSGTVPGEGAASKEPTSSVLSDEPASAATPEPEIPAADQFEKRGIFFWE